MSAKLFKFSSFCLILLHIGGCSKAEANFESFISGLSFKPEYTIEGFKVSGNTDSVILLMSWESFDLDKGHSEYSGSEAEQLQSAFFGNDALVIKLANFPSLKSGQTLTSEQISASKSSNSQQSFWFNTEKQLVLGSRQVLTLSIDELEDNNLAARVLIAISKTSSDPEGAMAGNIKGNFYIPVSDNESLYENYKWITGDKVQLN